MSYSYFLTCLDCGRSIYLGKTVEVQYENVAGPRTGFGMLGSNKPNHWQPSQEASEELQHFLYIHRGHEMRVVPETVNLRDDRIEFAFPTDDDTSDPLYSRREFFELSGGAANPDTDASDLPEDIIRRLKNSSPK